MPLKPVKHSLLVKATNTLTMDIGKLALVGGRPCLDFINTIDWRLDPDRRRDTLDDYSALLAFSQRVKLIDETAVSILQERARRFPEDSMRAFTEARSFRETLTALIDAGKGLNASQVEPTTFAPLLERFASLRQRAHAFERLSWEDGRLIATPRRELELLDHPWLMLVRDAEVLLFSPSAAKIRICAAQGCGWVYVDSSKNGTRRWCSMKNCGNREKARRFSRRQKDARFT